MSRPCGIIYDSEFGLQRCRREAAGMDDKGVLVCRGHGQVRKMTGGIHVGWFGETPHDLAKDKERMERLASASKDVNPMTTQPQAPALPQGIPLAREVARKLALKVLTVTRPGAVDQATALIEEAIEARDAIHSSRIAGEAAAARREALEEAREVVLRNACQTVCEHASCGGLRWAAHLILAVLIRVEPAAHPQAPAAAEPTGEIATEFTGPCPACKMPPAGEFTHGVVFRSGCCGIELAAMLKYDSDGFRHWSFAAVSVAAVSASGPRSDGGACEHDCGGAGVPFCRGCPACAAASRSVPGGDRG